MISNTAFKAAFSLAFCLFIGSEYAIAYFTFVDGSQIRRCRTLDEIDSGPVLDPFKDCPLVEATMPPAASVSDVTITTEVDFYFSHNDILERWTIPGQEPVERFFEYGVGGLSQWFGPCAQGYGNCYFGPSEAWTWEVYRSRRAFGAENLGTWKYEEFLGGELLTGIEFEMKELVLTEESTGSRIGIVNQNVTEPLRFRLATFEDSPEDPHPVAGETVLGTLTGPKGAKGSAVYGLGPGSKTDSNGIDSATVRLGSKPGVYTLKLDTRWISTQPEFDFFAIDDIDDLDPLREHPETEEGVGEGKGRACDQAGNPIRLSIGNKFQREVDIPRAGLSPIEFIRYHNSLGFVSTSFGNYWTHTYDRFIEIPANPSSTPVKVIRPDGRKINFSWNGSRFEAHAGIHAELEQSGAGWIFTDEDMTVESFDSDGYLIDITALNGVVVSASYDNNDRLARIESNLGGSLVFEYDAEDRLSMVTDQTGRSWRYGYEILGRLESVEFPDGTKREYHYEDLRHPYALTGITNQNGDRWSTYEYDDTGMAVASYHADGADRVDVRYLENGERIVLDPLGNATVYRTRIKDKRGFLDGISGPVCSQGCGLSDTVFEYDADSNLTSRTSFGVTTLLGDYDSRGQPGFRIEAAGTPDERRIDYVYDARFRNRIIETSEPSVFGTERLITEKIHDQAGNVIRETVSGYDPSGQPVSRTTTRVFDGPFAQITSIDGPRIDVDDTIRFEYYPNIESEGFNRGRLKAVVDPNGIRLRDNVQYSGTGKVLSESRPNGLIIEFNYFEASDRVRSMTESAAGAFNRTRWEYTPAGDVSMVIFDDETGQEIITRMFYDPAGRLYKAQSRVSREPSGQSHIYTAGQWEIYEFDGAGNVTSQTHSSADSINEEIIIQRVFDQYSRIDTITRGGVTEDYDYNPNGTLASRLDGNGITTSFSYDDFKRLTRTEQVGQIVTRTEYDVHGNISAVIDPENQATQFEFDDLGNLLRQVSPDTGETLYWYDPSGLLVRSVDAKGLLTEYAYDASGRVTRIDRAGEDDDVTYSYDLCDNGVGRLCSISTGWGHITEFEWNALGEKTSVRSGSGRVSYSYGPQGVPDSIVYPSGRAVVFEKDGGGLPTSISLKLDGFPDIVLLEEIEYSPLRRPIAWRFGNGHRTDIGLDARHRPVSIEVPGVWSWQAGAYDSNDNLLGVETASGSTTYAYDSQNRLTAAADPETSVTYGYDKVGNRVTRTTNGVLETGDYEPQSNRLQAFGDARYSLDENGNTVEVSDPRTGDRNYRYSSHNRLLEVVDPRTGAVLVSYRYDGLGQRVAETSPAGSREFVYGTSGELLAVIDGDGTVLHEYVYLDGLLVADLFEIPSEIPPDPRSEVTVDSEGPGADVSGSHWASKSDPEAWNGSYLQTRKFDDRTVRWFVDEPGFEGGYFDVFVKWMKSPGDGTRTRYRLLRHDLQTNNGYWTHVTVDHDGLDVGDWAFLGNFEYEKAKPWGRYQGIYLMGNDNRGGAAGSLLKADAVRLVPTTNPRSLVNLRYIHTDHLGTPHAVTDDTGEVVWTAEYAPFGEALVNENPDGDLQDYELNIRFPGQYYNETSGLHYNYFRDYDPRLGRYIESDPIGLDGGLNTFVYVGLSPLASVDPLGLVTVGSWIETPKFNLNTVNVERWEIVSPSLNWWGYLRFLRLYGSAEGFINLDIRCSDECVEWEVHDQIMVTGRGSYDVGPNLFAMITGLRFGPAAAISLNVAIGGASLLKAEHHFLEVVNEKAGPLIGATLASGPTALCLASTFND